MLKPKLIKDLGMIFPNPTSKRKKRYGIFECPLCTKHYKTNFDAVRDNDSKSCGCYKKLYSHRKTHGLRNHRLYRIWYNLKYRCNSEKGKFYKDYGGRGITYCKEWGNFLSFYKWAIANGYKENLTIDRINNDGNYEPTNCRWVTQNIQTRNTRKLVSTNTSGYRGVTKKNKKWISQIVVNSKHITIGSFNTKIEAAKAYDKYVLDNNLEHTINGVL